MKEEHISSKNKKNPKSFPTKRGESGVAVFVVLGFGEMGSGSIPKSRGC